MSAEGDSERPPSRRGRVVRVSEGSFDGLEAAARVVDAKGVYFDRGAHPHNEALARWLHGQEEDELANGEFAHGQLLIAAPRDECDESDCKDASCQDTGQKTKPALAKPDDVRDACAQLVAGLPSSFRDAVRSDAEALAGMCARLCPEVPWLTLRLEVVQYDA